MSDPNTKGKKIKERKTKATTDEGVSGDRRCKMKK
jgi:hypothetical protein